MPAGQYSTNISEHVDSDFTKIPRCYPRRARVIVIAIHSLLKAIKVSFLFPSCQFLPGVSLRCHLNVRTQLALALRRGRQSAKPRILMGKMCQPRNRGLRLKHPLRRSSLLDVLDVLVLEQEVELVNSRSLEHSWVPQHVPASPKAPPPSTLVSLPIRLLQNRLAREAG
jgi:hypothetical protein